MKHDDSKLAMEEASMRPHLKIWTGVQECLQSISIDSRRKVDVGIIIVRTIAFSDAFGLVKWCIVYLQLHMCEVSKGIHLPKWFCIDPNENIGTRTEL